MKTYQPIPGAMSRRMTMTLLLSLASLAGGIVPLRADPVALNQDATVVTNVTAGVWIHYEVAIPSDSPGWRLVLEVTAGEADLYIRQNGVPTTSSNTARSIRTGSDGILRALSTTARFRSVNGADLDWYAARGIAPEGEETWADVDARPVTGKGTTLLRENIADTNPNIPDDRLRILGVAPGPPVTVIFEPASAARDFTLEYTDDLTADVWAPVPGQGPRPGGGGPDAFEDDDDAPTRFYRINVRLP